AISDRTANATEGTAADQRAASAKGTAAGRTKRRSGTQESGNRAGPPSTGRKGQGVGAYFQVQIGIPGQHVARAAHSIKQHFGSGPAVERQRRQQFDPQASGV